ncbi:entry exclusion lipoprotein TrbK [Pseudomonas sp. NPDC089401]|uniref:entry exclusion lipoprotein TrbK n=1 Tax=Pseudomonas sp. NPDC089401 TaxID=3364462 RepID=UPI00380F1908
MKQCLAAIFAAALALGLAGCKEEFDYSVSDEHCSPEYWEKLPDDVKQKNLIDECSRQEHSGGGFSKKSIGPDELPKKLTSW